MRSFITASTTFFLLFQHSISTPSILATTECSLDVSYPIKTILDDGNLFGTCAVEFSGVHIDIRSLFDVLSFSKRDFLRFCRAPSCIKPVKSLLQTIPSDCLIVYHGTARNLSEEVSALYHQPQDPQETLKPNMNWMTSGKHRALYSQRGRRRQMHFPSQVQRQRVKPTSPSRSSEPRARDSAKPWYIVSIGDDDESQGPHPQLQRMCSLYTDGLHVVDIRVLELERKGAISATESEAEEKARKISRVGERGDARAPSGPSQKRGREQEQRDQGGRSDNRCIFTPVKKARKYEQPSRPAQLVKNAREKRPPSSIASGVEMLFFNDGEELPHKNRAQSRKRVAYEPVLYDTHSRKFPQRIGDARDEKELQVNVCGI
ncbi:hypothetical protein AM587_10017742 [Phytophthora nicotianae]|uniref:Uncharacterized protein n=1 Tax=Phytophthora nicotianae TaxID=4792 RepID=A0A0W8BZQ9_PHYNI|nr:hypothetical protein AM587_10017742 [Phytophthora nicotianae]